MAPWGDPGRRLFFEDAVTLDDLKANKPLLAVLALLLVVLAAWGSRETTHKKERTEAEQRVASLTEQVTKAEKARTESEQRHRSEINAWKKRVVVVNADGSRTETEEETSQAVQETEQRLRTEYESTLATARTETEKLTKRIQELETTTVKSAPRWLALVENEPLAGTWHAGAGINLGPVSIYGSNPVLPELRPRVGLALRF